ncbi:MAG: multiheme c-type cytochrome [Myxococcales bacterium]|nr:cytochrome c family protein [Myxococcales bacterium]
MTARALIVALLIASAAFASDLVGPSSCRTCHGEAYRIWSQGPHARAAQALSPEQRRQPLCLQCHSRDEQRAGQADVSGVSCETCHGGGRYYQPSAVMRDKELAHLFGLQDPTPSTCLVCHGGTSPSLKAFDVKEAMARIDHWTADRAARKQASGHRLPATGDRLASWLKR